MIPDAVYKINNKDPEDKKRYIRHLFDTIVPTYDLLNHVLSFGMDFLWRRRMFRYMRSVKNERAIDLCCGTGDVSRLLSKAGAGTVSLDFSSAMLERARRKGSLTGFCVAADASRMPFVDSTFSAATIAFGIRNIPDLDNFIREVIRVLKPGGEFVILELVRPRSALIRVLYYLYLRIILPVIGGLMSGKLFAYKYLSKTIETFVDPAELRDMLERYGLAGISQYPMTLGSAMIIVGKKGI